MRSIPASYNRTPDNGVHPALRSVADEGVAVVARLLAYVGVLAAVVMGAIAAFDGLEFDLTPALAPQPGWSAVERPSGAAGRHPDTSGKTAVYGNPPAADSVPRETERCAGVRRSFVAADRSSAGCPGGEAGSRRGDWIGGASAPVLRGSL